MSDAEGLQILLQNCRCGLQDFRAQIPLNFVQFRNDPIKNAIKNPNRLSAIELAIRDQWFFLCDALLRPLRCL
jgi:hypothetical protein